MNEKKYIVILILCILTLSGCTGTKEEIMKEEDKIKIGLSFDSFVIERWHREQDAFVARAEQLGAEVDVQNANGEVSKQIEQIEYFIKNKMDVIVVVATDGEALLPVLKRAQEADIKIVAYDRLIENANVDLYLSFDNAEIGRLLTKSIIGNTREDGNIIVVFGPHTDHNVEIIEAEFDRLMADKKINIINKSYAVNWKPEEAFYAVSNGINQEENIDAVFCGNDDLAGEAIRALAEKRLAGKVCVVGQDGDLSACQRVVEGTQEMTVYKDVIQLAKLGAEYAVELVENKKSVGDKLVNEVVSSKLGIKKSIKEISALETINDGTYEVPCYLLKPIKVTKENMNEVIIESGFHKKEDVYLNLMEIGME